MKDIARTEREQFRSDHSNQFLRDVLDSPNHGHDPRDNVGVDCGINWGRALQIAFDRVGNRSLWSDLPGHVNHVAEV